MRIKDLLAGLHIEGYVDEQTIIRGIKIDSKEVTCGDLFVAIPGSTFDGHKFVDEVIEKGASAVVVNRVFVSKLNASDDIYKKLIVVKDTNKVLGTLASRFYKNPTGTLNVVGVTGTNGKTTVTHLISELLRYKKLKVGVLGTVGHDTGKATYAAKNTTPHSLETHKMAHELLVNGGQYLIMEVSSHAIANNRLNGIHYDMAVFTNITQDHLDFHKTFDNYRLVKGMFLTSLGTVGEKNGKEILVVLNGDDPNFPYFESVTLCNYLSYGIEGNHDVIATNLVISLNSTKFIVNCWKGNIEIETNLVGNFSVYNALAAITVALARGMTLREIQRAFREIKGVSGRFELVTNQKDFTVIVDYAHTPDGLENVLKTAKLLIINRIIVVFGCGGDRDKGKRPLMAGIAEKYADFSIVTNDNPRTENPSNIVDDIVKGFSNSKFEVILDRKKAIYTAINMAVKDDIILIVGKGHETVQIIGDTTMEFNDKLVAENILKELDVNGVDCK